MLRIDFYVQHLVRHNALGIQLRSDQPVRFRFQAGDRQSTKPISHAQIRQLVQEAAPTEVRETILRAGSGRFVHDSAAGIEVEVQVDASDINSWQVDLSPAGAELGPKPSERPGDADYADSVAAAEEDLAAAKVSSSRRSAPPPAPRVEVSPDEPKINRYLRMMKSMEASDLHLSSDVPPMVRLHGEMQQLEPTALGHDELESLLLEIAPEKNRAEFEAKSDTDFSHSIEGVARFRANVFMDRKGIGGVFRQIPFEILSPDKIGLPKKVLDLCWLSKGLVLVTGPTGSGKSTTLATLIDYINDSRTDHIITIEDPIEFVHGNKKCLVNQREVGTHTQSFKNALRAALREDPDIVLVGEMRDLETIHIAIETAETGHLVFGTLHTTSAISTVDRLIDQFPPEQQAQVRVMLSESLRGVIAQVLCKKKGGGRVAGYEILLTNPAVSNLIREGKTFQLTSVMQTGKNLGMQTMNEHLLQHVKNGLVEPEEAYIKTNDKQQLRDMFQRNNIQLDLGNDASK